MDKKIVEPRQAGRSQTPSTEDPRYKFTGKELDNSDGLFYFGARYYDPWRGQWLQVDPLVDKYPSWSCYNYVMTNPMRSIDPDGQGVKDSVIAQEMKEWQEQLKHEKEKLKESWSKGDVVGTIGHLLGGAWDALKIQSSTFGLIPEVGAIEGGSSEIVNSVVESAGRQYNSNISVGARSLAKKLGHAESGGFESAFKGIEPTSENAQTLVKNILTNPSRVIKGNVTTDIYNSAGQGIRIDNSTHKFLYFIEGTKATR